MKSLADHFCGMILAPRCSTPEEAERIADHVAEILGLPRKTILAEGFAFAYEDAARNVRLEVEIGHANYHGTVDCWAFRCSAGRIDGSFSLKPQHRYRKIPALFQSDAASLVQDVIAGEVERRLKLTEKVAAEQSRPDRFVGTLKTWIDDKQYGFLQCSGMSDTFLHIQEVKLHQRKYLHKGQTFSFKRQKTAKGWRAVEAEHLE